MSGHSLINTYTGRTVNPLRLLPEDIRIEDVAHALAMQCRFGGHCSDFHSVAAHSLLVSSACPPEHALWGLLHDASEAYLVDLPGPLKRGEVGDGYREAEGRIMRAIALRFGLTRPRPPAVHAADLAVFAAEWAGLMTASGPLGWGDARGIELVLMTPRQAEQAFLDRFARLRDAAAGPACCPDPMLSQVAAEESDVQSRIRAAMARKARMSGAAVRSAAILPDADLCLRWRARRHSWRHRSEGGFDARRYDVAALSEADAKAFVAANHYSGSYPAARLRYGLHDGPWLVGVAVLAIPMQRRVLTTVFPELEPYEESLDLARFCLAESVAANGESWFLARCWELAAREGVRGVVSFSDPVPRRTSAGELVFPGHIGTIYQASNAAYLGRTAPRRLLLLPDGRVLSERALAKVRADDRGHAYVERELVGFGARPRRAGEAGAAWLREALPAAGVRLVVHGGNHRYAFRIGARRRLVAVGMPTAAYPKAVAA